MISFIAVVHLLQLCNSLPLGGGLHHLAHLAGIQGFHHATYSAGVLAIVVHFVRDAIGLQVCIICMRLGPIPKCPPLFHTHRVAGPCSPICPRCPALSHTHRVAGAYTWCLASPSSVLCATRMITITIVTRFQVGTMSVTMCKPVAAANILWVMSGNLQCLTLRLSLDHVCTWQCGHVNNVESFALLRELS
jgi:hypothetical protein